MFVQDVDVNLKVMECKDYSNPSVLVSGRTLLNQAKAILKNMKKANSVTLPYLDEGGNPKESGQTMEDVINNMMDDMYELLEGPDADEDSDDEDKENDGSKSAPSSNKKRRVDDGDSGGGDSSDGGDEDPQPSTRPHGWRFKGYVAFLFSYLVLFGKTRTPIVAWTSFAWTTHQRKTQRKKAPRLTPVLPSERKRRKPKLLNELERRIGECLQWSRFY